MVFRHFLEQLEHTGTQFWLKSGILSVTLTAMSMIGITQKNDKKISIFCTGTFETWELRPRLSKPEIHCRCLRLESCFWDLKIEAATFEAWNLLPMLMKPYLFSTKTFESLSANEVFETFALSKTFETRIDTRLPKASAATQAFQKHPDKSQSTKVSVVTWNFKKLWRLSNWKVKFVTPGTRPVRLCRNTTFNLPYKAI